MKITQAQVREIAQAVYPKQWREDPANAAILAIRFLAETIRGSGIQMDNAEPKLSLDSKRPSEIAELESHIKENQIHVTAAAKALNVNAVTLYSWFHGHTRPRAENLTKIRAFLTKTKP